MSAAQVMPKLAQRSIIYLVAPLTTTVISLGILPLATKIVGAEEYGALALAVGIAVIITAISQASIGYVLAERHGVNPPDRFLAVVKAALASCCIAGGLAAVVLLVLGFAVGSLWNNLPGGQMGFTLTAIATAIALPWTVWSETAMLQGKAIHFVAGAVLQSMANGFVTLLFLYVWPLPEFALFLGYAAGQAVLSILAIIGLRSMLSVRMDRSAFADMKRSAPAIARATGGETARGLFERSMLAGTASVADLGVFAHAQLYRNCGMMLINSISRATLPTNLVEARKPAGSFPITTATWEIAQALVSIVCFGFALFGSDVVRVLTSGKFDGAFEAALVLLLALLVQTVGKREQSILIANSRGELLSNATTAGICVGVAALAVIVPLYGALGAAWALLAQTVTQRALVVYFARSIHALKPRERVVAIGIALTVAANAWVILVDPSFLLRVVVLLVTCRVAVVLVRPALRIFLSSPDGRQV